jgi:hypothetical protein
MDCTENTIPMLQWKSFLQVVSYVSLLHDSQWHGLLRKHYLSVVYGLLPSNGQLL